MAQGGNPSGRGKRIAKNILGPCVLSTVPGPLDSIFFFYKPEVIYVNYNFSTK